MKTFEELVEVASKANGYLGGAHEDAIKAAARVCERAITDRIWGPLPWVPRPGEIPDRDEELHDAATSTKVVDRQLKMAVLGWKWANESVEVENAERLRVCVLNFADLEPLRDAGDEDARQIQITLFVYAKRSFDGADISKAPREREELGRWCRRVASKGNPVPVWLRIGAPPRSAWKPQRGGDPVRAGSLFTGEF